MADPNLLIAFADATKRSGDKFRSEILTMPKAVIAETIKNMTYVNGLHGKETTPIMKSGAQLMPYKPTKNANNTVVFTERTLETYLSDVMEEFDPASAYGTMFDEKLTVEKINFDITRDICKEIARQACDGLNLAMWKGKRNAAGNTVYDICDGFDTIITNEKAAGNISVAAGNYFQLGNLTVYNICDKLRRWWRKQNSKFKKQEVNLWVPEHILEMYEDGYALKFATHQYNTEFEKNVLYGTHSRVKLCSAYGMSENEHIFMTPKMNTRVGGEGGTDFGDSNFVVRVPDNPKLCQFYMTAFFGVNFVTLDKEYFTCASLTSSDSEPMLTWDPENVDFGEVTVGETSTKTVHIAGESLTQTTTVNVTGSAFSCATASVTAASANAEGGVDLSVVFTPAEAGAATGKLKLTNAVDGVEVEILLTGKGKAAVIGCTATPASVVFETTAPNATTTAEVIVKGVALTANLTVAIAGDSEITKDISSITKADANGASGKKITLTYAPTAAGTHAAVLRITSATDGIDITIPVLGTSAS